MAIAGGSEEVVGEVRMRAVPVLAATPPSGAGVSDGRRIRRILKDEAISLRPINEKRPPKRPLRLTLPNLLAVGSQNKLAIPQGRYPALYSAAQTAETGET
jgi:hypothetical protein